MKISTPSVEIIPTVVPGSLEDVIAARARSVSFATTLHVDAADGAFAPNTTWVPASGERFPDAKDALYEAHLMVAHPLLAGVSFARAGARRIIGHIEAFRHSDEAREVFNMWREAGTVECSLAILMATALDALPPYLDLVDSVLIMSIASIGVQGIPFDPRGIERVAELRKRHPKLTIAVDGGVSEKNIASLAHAGVSRFSVGSALANAPDPAAMHARLLDLAAQAQR